MPVKDLAYRGLCILLQELLAILLNILEYTTQLRLLQADTSIEDNKLYNPDHTRQVIIIVIYFFPYLDI